MPGTVMRYDSDPGVLDGIWDTGLCPACGSDDIDLETWTGEDFIEHYFHCFHCEKRLGVCVKDT